jgi:hypothetical protein
MTTPPPAQSPLSEAVEQAADSVKLLGKDLTDLSRSQADRLSSGGYGLSDLVGGGFALTQLAVKHTTAAYQTFLNNISLLAAPPPDPAHGHDPPVREVQGAVTVPAASVPAPGIVGFRCTELQGRRHSYRVPPESITVQPQATAASGQAGTSQVVILSINFGGAPNDIYSGEVQSGDPAVSTPFMVALAEFGVAGSAPEVTDVL